ncbi:MAG: lytic transglycosylase domain-containing protein [Caulobacterales bacterium]
MSCIQAVLAATVALCLSLAVSPVAAAPLQALSPQDARLYATAFDAAEKGDFAGADQSLAKVADPCLVGRVEYLKLVHPRSKSTFEELASWLKSFGDLPGADRVYALAMKLKPAGVAPPAPTAPPIATLDSGADRVHASAQSRPAREAYFDGDVRRALGLARSGGDAWIAGLANYRLGDFVEAMTAFETIAENPAENDWIRSGGAYWAARAAVAAGLPERATPFLKIAAATPDTFYGMIAARKLELADDPLGRVIEASTRAETQPSLLMQASYSHSDANALDRLVATDPRARRAVALAQLGRSIEAGNEIRTGLAQASSQNERAQWMGLMYALGPQGQHVEISLHNAAPAPSAVYPTPDLAPAGGYTVDKALVYAVVWQESRFNSLAVSPVGAIGLMQLMPPSAASMAGDTSLTHDPIPLFDTGKNLQLGQTYLNWLMEKSVGYDILRAVAAYNGGPSTVNKTVTLLGPDTDSLMVIESVPYSETRGYVQKVMAAYWSYRRQFGAQSRTLDAVASDRPFIDARLDTSAPSQDPKANAAPARQALEILLHHAG